MTYTPLQWQNGNVSAPYGPLNATRLAYIETGIQTLDAALTSAIASLNAGLTTTGDLTISADSDASGAGDLILKTKAVERLRVKTDGSLYMKTALARTSQQNPSYTTPAGARALEIDGYANLLSGANELIDLTVGSNLVLADFAYLHASRRIYSRSLLLTEVNDPVDLVLQRLGAPTTWVAEDATLPVATIYAAYIGAAFTVAGSVDINGQIVTYTGFSSQASTTVSGAQTLNRDSTGPLNVASTTNFRAGPGTARAGEHIIRYSGTGTSPTRLTGVSLIRCGATNSYAIPDGATVSQHKFTGCTGGTGAISYTDTVEQNNYPVPSSATYLSGLAGDGQVPGKLFWKPARNPASVPPGSDTTPGFSHTTAAISAFTAEHARDGKTGGNLLFATTPLGAGDPINRGEFTHDGSLRLGNNSTTGPNALAIASVAKLSIVNDTTTWRGLLVKGIAAQTQPTFEVQDENAVAVFTVALAGGVSIKGLTLVDATDITIATGTGSKIGQSGSKLSFYGNTPVVRPSAYTQTYATAARTHSNPTATTLTAASGTSDGTVADVGASFNQATLNNNFQDVATAINALIVDMANVKQVLNSVIDDDQAVGLKQ